jgi:uncharacterized protein YndB with AHSA1/START domain
MTGTTGNAAMQVAEQGERDLILRRDFTHPPAQVWRALTEAQFIRQWLTPDQAMTECRVDARAGGSFHYAWADFAFTGEIDLAEPPHRMRHVERFSLDPDYRVEVTTELVAHGTGTRMTVLMRYADRAARAAAVAAGFTDGLGAVYGRIEGLDLEE